MARKKKAEIASNIVMYIMTGVIVIAVVAFGVKQMMALNKDVGTIKCLNFQQEFKERLIKDRAYGTVDKDVIDVDCAVDKICFINLGEDPSGISASDLHPVILDLWETYFHQRADLPDTSNLKKNVFLVSEQENKIVGSFFVAGVKPPQPDNAGVKPPQPDKYLCLEVQPGGYIAPIIRGKGKYVIIEKAAATP